MDFVSRAKELVKQQVRGAALVIVPLAAAASAQAVPFLPTQAIPSLPTGNADCVPSKGSCSAIADPLPDPGNGLLGVKFYTSGSVVMPFQSGSGNGSLALSTSGIQSGSFSGDIPLLYDFTLDGNSVGSWTLGFAVNQISGASHSVQVSGSGSGQFTGSSLLASVVLQSGLTTQVSMTLSVDYDGSLTINIPANSVDFNADAGNSGVPEPSSAAMVLIGSIAAGGFQLMRRRRKS